MTVDHQLTRARQRASHINTLTCNAGLELCCYRDLYTNDIRHVIALHEDCDGPIMGYTQVYQHERSAVRAIWRMFKKWEDSL